MVFIKHRIFATSLFVLFLKVAAYTPWITEASETHNSDFTSDNTSREAIDFLKYGENVVKLNNSIDDVTLVFGDSGDGTTTLVQWLATDGGNLSAVKYEEYPFYYYIADGNKIRNSSHISKTKFPELVVDENANISFYDFPGFKEVQSPKDELAAKYFIQKVIDHVECVKIILVMSQRGSRNRNQCINFMKRVTHFVRNIEKFQNSIAIVVTKVNTSLKEIVDEEIFKMGEFFETKVKNHLKSQNDTKIIPLIDILTQKTNNNYSRIGIFPKPKESGPLSKRNLYLIRYKQFIQKIIQEMECIPKDDNFYPLSINNKTFINHLAREIVKNIANDMKKEYIELIEKMDRKIASFTNINNYRRTRENITVSKDFRDKMMKIDDEFRTQSVDIISKYDSKNEASYLKFLNVLHIPSLNDYFTQIANDLKTRKEVLMKDVDEGFQKIINNTAFNINIIGREIYEYYESHMKFTLGYKQAVSELNQLKNILNYFEEPQNESQNILELSNQMRETIDKLNIDIRTRETINDKIVDLQYMHNQTTFFTNLNPNINLTYDRFSKPFENTIKDLNDLQTWYEFLSDLYTNRDEISENAATALSYRNDSMFSQEIKQVSTKYKYNLGELDESKLEELEQIVLLKTPADKKPCSKEYDYKITGYNIKLSDYIQFNDTLECANGGKIKTVKIFAVNMIIIDVDLRATQTQLQVIIIAQKWNIDGKREIVLNGAPPDAKLSKTNNCIFPHGIDGNNGEPGLPGKPGGHFIGIGETFINGNLLTISVDGGNGSAGQDGENGCPGKNGEPAKLPQGFFGKSLHEGNFTEAIKPYDIDINEMPSEIANATYFRINGTKGGEGGKGGNGGKGGKGGYEGSVEIIYLDNRLHNIIQVSAKKGNTGKGGKGGDGGSGGINGDGTIIEYLPGVVTYQIKMVPSNTTAPKGPNGENDSYEAGIREPEKLSSPPTIATITNQYNQFLRQRLKNMKNKKIKNFIKDFYTKLNSNITKSYDILHMIQEFYDLENQLPEINEQDSLPFYETLLNKIEGYRLQLNDEENRVLKYLNDTVSSKIHNLKENTSPTLITNISQYLERIEENIKIIKAFQERNSRHTAIKEYKNEYKNITKRIEDLENFINKIAEEFEEINRQMDEHIDKIIKEITELKNDHERKQNELNTKRIELQRILISKGILKITNTTQQIFGITKNKKQNVGGLMQIMNEKTELRLLSEDEILEHITNGIKKNKINNLKKCLNTIPYEKLRVHEDQFTNIIKVINNTSKKLRGTRNYDELTFKTVIDLEDDLKKALKEKESEIKLHNKSKEALSILKDISCNILTSSLPFNIYDENNQNQNSLDEISKAINDDNTIQNLERYEKFFFKLIVDVLERTRVEFKNAINKLDSKSLVSSVEYKWRIQAFLKYIQSEIQELSSEKYDTSMLKNYLQKLNNAMTTLVNVYDCITRYKEQETLMEYTADIISLAIKSTTVNNATLSEALGKLEISMISNLILKEHKLLMTSFIQWVFPFADHFLRNFTSPSRFKVENNIQNLICNVMEQEKSLLSKLRTYKSSLGIYDKFINYEEFDSNGTSTKPFYVWKNEERNREISYLLGGKSIKLYADIRRSFAEKYAIKFNTISIHLKSKNQTLQPKIDKELEKFELRIVHSGDSYYRYGDKFYKISSGNTYKIRHNLEKNSQGEWKSKNQVYTKIKDGDIILSPYTVWQMQLTPHEGYNFDELSSYKNEVDLELIGTGSFINEILDLQLEKYYKEFSERE